jgi:hypothetical protein
MLTEVEYLTGYCSDYRMRRRQGTIGSCCVKEVRLMVDVTAP